VNGQRAQIWVGDYVLGSYGTGAIIAVPAHDERDYDFAKKHGIEIIPVIANPDGSEAKLPYTDAGVMVNSGKYDGMKSEEFKKRIVEDLAKTSQAQTKVNYKLHDWGFSRQRYWGEPFPIVWISAADYAKIDRANTKLVLPEGDVSYTDGNQTFFAVGLPYASLPLVLPEIPDYRPADDGRSPLARHKEWTDVFVNLASGETHTKPQCDKCVPAERETNIMPQWAGSCWYYLRYIDPHNPSAICDPAKEKYWGMPDFYIGGTEHAVLHLLYARFWHQFLYDQKIVQFPEPFPKLFHQGIILAEDGEKMSKSRGNVINPDDIVAEYGADTLRMYLMFLGPLEAMKPWSSAGIEGVHRFLRKAFRLVVGQDGNISSKVVDGPETNPETEKLLHATIKKVGEDLEGLHYNTAISALMILLNQMASADSVSRSTAIDFVKLLAPLAPHICEELWARLGGAGLVDFAPWPTYDERKLVASTIKMAVQVNGKLRAELELPAEVSQADAIAAARENEKVKPHLEGKTIRKEIFVKGRLINLVVG
jgi:leucyl-tRNA synthetase